MKKIGIIVKKGVPEAIDAVKVFLQQLKRKRFKTFIEDEIASALGIRGYSRQELCSKADLIVVFGGDGTLLSVARLVGDKGIPILGVNLGGLGFITETNKEEFLQDKINNLFSEKWNFEERIMLLADVYREKRKLAEYNALNDVVINKSALSRMIEFDVYINNQFVTAFRADGLIISTPTGSTAHSLSAGGPILYPTLESFVMTPICPHTLTNRPIVLPDKFAIEVNIKSGEDIYLTLDGQVGFPLEINDKVRIKKADYKIRFLLLRDREYFKILRTKLKWGER